MFQDGWVECREHLSLGDSGFRLEFAVLDSAVGSLPRSCFTATGHMVWQNTSPQPQHWIDRRLTGTKSNRDGIGARVRIGTQFAEMSTTAGYASSVDTPLHFGLGAVVTVPRIEIRWPSGTVQVLTDVKADRVLTVTEK